MPLPSKQGFCAFLQYSPKGTSATSQTSRTITYAVKNDSTIKVSGKPTAAIPFVVDALAASIKDHSCLQPLFGPGVLAVPMPKSSLYQEGFLWVPRVICKRMKAAGLVASISRLLVRRVAVNQSSRSTPGQRPTAQKHYDSLAVEEEDLLDVVEPKILLVDDVITRGATMIAAITRLREAFPNKTINGFSLIRTMSGSEVASVLDPVAGTISCYPSGQTHREP